MLQEERWQCIERLLNEHPYLSINEICEMLFFSESTIRRDLRQMQQKGRLQRVRGGAMIKDTPNVEKMLSQRKKISLHSKMQIGACAASFVEDGDTLFLDDSTTVQQLIPSLKGKKDLIIVSNGLETANLVTDNLNCRFMSTGGLFRQQTCSFVGGITVSMIRQHMAKKMFFSATAISAVRGITDHSTELTPVKKAFIDQAEQVFLLMDETKFNKAVFSRVCDLDRIDTIITTPEADLSGEEWEPWREKIIFAQPLSSKSARHAPPEHTAK